MSQIFQHHKNTGGTCLSFFILSPGMLFPKKPPTNLGVEFEIPPRSKWPVDSVVLRLLWVVWWIAFDIPTARWFYRDPRLWTEWIELRGCGGQHEGLFGCKNKMAGIESGRGVGYKYTLR